MSLLGPCGKRKCPPSSLAWRHPARHEEPGHSPACTFPVPGWLLLGISRVNSSSCCCSGYTASKPAGEWGSAAHHSAMAIPSKEMLPAQLLPLSLCPLPPAFFQVGNNQLGNCRTSKTSWRVQLQLNLGEARAACATLVSSGFTCGSLGSQLLHLGSALPSSFAVNGVISTFCCLLVWQGSCQPCSRVP